MATQGITRRGIIGAIALWALPTVPLLARAQQAECSGIWMGEPEWAFMPYGTSELTLVAGSELWVVRVLGRGGAKTKYATGVATPEMFSDLDRRKLVEWEVKEFLRRDLRKYAGVAEARLVGEKSA